jgi:hypothetical protein
MIQEVEPGRLFTVKSQSTADLWYTVDLEAYTCQPCPSFPAIQFCKHICAVEDHFPDLVLPHSLPLASQPWDQADPLPHTNQLSISNSAPAISLAVTREDAHLLQIISKLQFIHRSNVTLPESPTTSLQVLDGALADATKGAEILPRTAIEKVASNQGTASETASVMGTQRKGAKKRKQVDPYGAGQASGKSARPDARTSKKPRLSPSTSASQDAENLDLDDFDDLTTPDLSPPPTSAVVSPQDAAALPPVGPLASTDAEAQMELMNILARYNTMFPADVPQRTSYYRENTCVVPATAHLPTSTSSYYRTR